jgi:hypothetical protein
VVDSSGNTSAPKRLNAPEPWWCQGDAGDAATPGGWVRCFGLAMATVNGSVAVARQRLRYLRHVLAHVGGLDDPAGDDSLLYTAATEIVALRSQLASLPASYSLLTLTPQGWTGPTVTVRAFAANATQYSVQFPVPGDIASGTYSVGVSNGLGTGLVVPLDSFVSPGAPHASGLEILPAAGWPPGVFLVNATTPPAPMPAPTSDAALATAISAAWAAGGGTIQLARGQYFLSQPVLLPPRTRLVGAGTELTAIYFEEATPATAPYAYFGLAPGPAAGAPSRAPGARAFAGVTATSWGVTDLTVRREQRDGRLVAAAGAGAGQRVVCPGGCGVGWWRLGLPGLKGAPWALSGATLRVWGGVHTHARAHPCNLWPCVAQFMRGMAFPCALSTRTLTLSWSRTTPFSPPGVAS